MKKLSANDPSTEVSSSLPEVPPEAIIEVDAATVAPSLEEDEPSFEELYELVGSFVINDKLSIKKYKAKTVGPDLYSLVHFHFEEEIFLKEGTFEDLVSKFPKIKSFNL